MRCATQLQHAPRGRLARLLRQRASRASLTLSLYSTPTSYSVCDHLFCRPCAEANIKVAAPLCPMCERGLAAEGSMIFMSVDRSHDSAVKVFAYAIAAPKQAQQLLAEAVSFARKQTALYGEARGAARRRRPAAFDTHSLLNLTSPLNLPYSLDFSLQALGRLGSAPWKLRARVRSWTLSAAKPRP